jgi:hypothetical protein
MREQPPHSKVIMKNKELRDKLFASGVQALQKITDKQNETYICPICIRRFSRQALRDKKLSLDHVPPASIGALIKILTCKECNNTSGNSIDANMANHNKVGKFAHAVLNNRDEESEFRVKLNNSLNYDLKIKKNYFELSPSGNDPDSLKKFEIILNDFKNKKTWNRCKLTLSYYVKLNPWLAKVGDLRTAYLIAFAAFGYKYALRARLHCVREQIWNPREHLLDHFHSPIIDAAQKNHVLAIANKPFEFVFVQFNQTRVFLPWINGPTDVYKELASFAFEKDSQISGSEIPWPKYPHYRLDYT